MVWASVGKEGTGQASTECGEVGVDQELVEGRGEVRMV
mgnify:CR=1 FL=1